jgi:hypothetical protein
MLNRILQPIIQILFIICHTHSVFKLQVFVFLAFYSSLFMSNTFRDRWHVICVKVLDSLKLSCTHEVLLTLNFIAVFLLEVSEIVGAVLAAEIDAGRDMAEVNPSRFAFGARPQVDVGVQCFDVLVVDVGYHAICLHQLLPLPDRRLLANRLAFGRTVVYPESVGSRSHLQPVALAWLPVRGTAVVAHFSFVV